MKKNIVIAFSGQSSNDAISGLIAEWGAALSSAGLSMVHVTPEPADLQRAVKLLSAGQVSFAMTWLGIGQDLSVMLGPKQQTQSAWGKVRMLASGRRPAKIDRQATNAWEYFRVPLLKFHGDLPAYFVDYHRDIPHNAVNLYHGTEFMHFRRRWIPDARALMTQIPPLPLAPIERSKVNLSARRKGKLVFIKNGNSPSELTRRWQEYLPASIARMLVSMAEEITGPGCRPGILYIGDFVATFLGANSIDPDSARDLVVFFSAQLDDYLRRIKSRMIAESILDLPVIVQGDSWNHVDFSGRQAQWVEGQDFASTQRVFADELGIIDMSPNTDTFPHDRVQRAAGSFATVLTNRQAWLKDSFPEFEKLTFEFDPQAIESRVADAIARPDEYLELGLAFGMRFRELYPQAAFVQRIVNLADLATLQWSENKPPIQPFFAWRRHH
jgi:hypothetical protein